MESQSDKDYTLGIFKTVIDRCLDEMELGTEEKLKSFESNHDQVVWELATKIYSQTGHRVELFFVRDVVNSRIEAEKCQLAENQQRIAKKQTNLLHRVRKVVSEQLGVDEQRVKLDSHLILDLGMDELEPIELMMALEEEFEIEIQDEAEYECCFTFESLVNFVRKQASNRNS